MSQRDKILREILSDKELMEKYSLTKKEVENTKCAPPYSKKIIQVMATILNENANNRSSRQIYTVIKNIHKI